MEIIVIWVLLGVICAIWYNSILMERDLQGKISLLREERGNLEESCDELQDKLSEKQYELDNLQEEASVAMSVLKDVLG